MNKKQQTTGEQLYNLITDFAEQKNITTVELAGYLETIKMAVFIQQQEKANKPLPPFQVKPVDLTQYR